MNLSDTFYWHDYETSGDDPTLDRPWQFAGVRTNIDLEIIDEPLTLYSRPTPDRLPRPAAVRVTGITPQRAELKGIKEAEFIQRILAEFLKPRTCGIGYNSIRFDDELTRFTLWRNFRDPYAREWRNNGSRWDLFNITLAFWALSPEGIEWPLYENGTNSFRLEDLTLENGIEHGAAHDALADVIASIELAKKFRAANVDLFDTLYKLRFKRDLSALVDIHRLTPLVHVSNIFGAARHHTAVVVPVAWHPKNKSEVICVDLAERPDFLKLNPNIVRDRLFTRREDLPAGVYSPPLKTIKLNRSPVLLPTSWLAGSVAKRLGLNGDDHRAHLAILRESREKDPQLFVENLQSIWKNYSYPVRENPDQMLYDGFVSDTDRALCDHVCTATPEDLKNRTWSFEDPRLRELLFRFKARNYPESLTLEEKAQWREHCQAQWRAGDFTIRDFEAQLVQELSEAGISDATRQNLNDLGTWVTELTANT